MSSQIVIPLETNIWGQYPIFPGIKSELNTTVFPGLTKFGACVVSLDNLPKCLYFCVLSLCIFWSCETYSRGIFVSSAPNDIFMVSVSVDAPIPAVDPRSSSLTK